MIDPTPKCLVPECSRPPKHRGLCKDCYGSATRAVRRGKTTWEQLQSLGLAAPALTGGPTGGLFLSALKAATEKGGAE